MSINSLISLVLLDCQQQWILQNNHKCIQRYAKVIATTSAKRTPTNPPTLQLRHMESHSYGFILTIKDRCIAGQKRDHGILSLAKVKPVDISTGRKSTLNFNHLGPIDPIASAIMVPLFKDDSLVWWSWLNWRGWHLIGLLTLCISTIPPLLWVLFQANHISRCESNDF